MSFKSWMSGEVAGTPRYHISTRGMSGSLIKYHSISEVDILIFNDTWFENLSERQIKAPKICIRDSGILHMLLPLSSLAELRGHPKLGASWEGFALE